MLNGALPANMMRLRGQMNLPMKDSLTLSFYNIPDGAIIELGTKNKK